MSPYSAERRQSHLLRTWWRPLLAVMVVLLGVSYVVELNLISSRGFQARRLEQRLNSLREENRRLNLQVAELQSLTSVGERIQTLGLVPAESVQYLTVGGAAVARR